MIRRAMERPTEPLRGALATLQTRWGSAVVRLGDGRAAGSPAASASADTAVHGALALAARSGLPLGGTAGRPGGSG